MTKYELMQAIEETKARSYWKRGVRTLAVSMAERFEVDDVPQDRTEIRRLCLNGAGDFKQLSYGGCYEIYNEDIAQLLCTPSELKRCRGGEKAPHHYETWLDVQARALYQAYQLICRCVLA